MTSSIFEPLERRALFCTLDGQHIPELHGPETAETEPNDTLATATPFGTNDALAGTLSSSADLDHWQRTLNQGERLRVRVGSDPGQRHYKPLVQILSPTGAVLMSSGDGHELNFYAPQTATYYVKISSASRYGTITGSYGTSGGSNLIAVAVTPVSGTVESEPNDTPATADVLAGPAPFRGALDSSSDDDWFRLSGEAGGAVAVRWNGLPQENPSLRLYDADDNLLATDTSGIGLHHILPTTGQYRLRVSGDNAAGAVSGGYIGTLTVAGSGAVVENETGTTAPDGAPAWPMTLGARAVGTLSGVGDVDLFSMNLVAGRWYSLSIESSPEMFMRAGRTISLLNEFGQPIETSYLGTLHTNAATGFGFRIEKTGRHFLAVGAIDANGLGGYIVSGAQVSTFPTQRDVPIVFHDYAGQTSHLGYGPAAPLTRPEVVPAFVGMFEARYDVYDLDVFTTAPGVPAISFGAGEFGSIGAYGYGGNFNLGSRRATGDSLLDDSGSGFTSLAGIQFPASVMNQEVGHAAGLYAHARNPQAFMAYDNQSAMNVIGTYFPFPWTDSRVPDVESRNEREFQDWVFQAGRNAEEAEPNDAGSPQNLDGFLGEMTADADPRNDRVAISGRIDSGSDVDVYSLTIAAGQTFALDIDSAEFQHPLDATMRVYDASGTLVARSFDAMDRESGLFTVDPYVLHTFAAAGTYTIHISGANGTIGNYRFKATSAAAFDTAGPRVIAAWPNGGANVDATRQLIFWFNDKLDPATLTSANIEIKGTNGGVRSGTAIFDPTDSTLIWRADAPLPVDSYMVTIRDVRDLRGNPLDGETDGTMTFPEISGDGTPGGEFVTRFSIFASDTTPAAVSSSSIRRHPYNRVLFTLNMNDELDVQSVYGSNLRLRGAGPDNIFNTPDDRFIPIDLQYDKIKHTSQRQLEIFTRGVPDFGSYRVEGALLDAAGNTVNISRNFSFTTSTTPMTSGPSVADLSVQPGTAVTEAINRLEVTFSAALNPATINGSSFVLRHSPDASFFDGNDSFITGTLAWDATNLSITFEAAQTLADGYYLLELDGGAGGIAAAASGQLLDGEYLDSTLAGNTLFSHWQDAPSGDGFAGGDYRAMFRVAVDATAPAVEQSDFVYQFAPHALSLAFSENVGASVSLADIVLENLTTSQTIPAGSLSLSFDPLSNTALLSFPGFASGLLPDGQYRATILATGVTDPAGNAMAANYVANFFHFTGDANHDGSVNLSDFNILAAHFGQTGATFSHGDFNYDGTVDLADFNLLSAKFGTALSPGRFSGAPIAQAKSSTRVLDGLREELLA